MSNRRETSNGSKAELIIHPLRLRMLQELAGRTLTAGQLGALLPDVPPATLYRHLGKLVAGEVLEVVAERPVRGTVEKVYTLREGGGMLEKADLESASPADHLRMFRLYAATLLSDLERYLAQDGADPLRDGLSYHSAPAALTDAEALEVREAVRQRLADIAARPVADGNVRSRRRRIISLIVMPGVEAPALEETECNAG